MKIFDNINSSSGGSGSDGFLIGDTRISARDLSSENYLNRSFRQVLQKEDFPELYEFYKQEVTDHLSDEKISITFATAKKIPVIETETAFINYTTNPTIREKSTGREATSTILLSSTDNDTIYISNGSNMLFAYNPNLSSQFANRARMSTTADVASLTVDNISSFSAMATANGNIQILTLPTTSTKRPYIVEAQIIGEYFYITVGYETLITGVIQTWIMFKVKNFTELSTITGVLSTDQTNAYKIYSAADINTTHSIAANYQSIILLEDESLIIKYTNVSTSLTNIVKISSGVLTSVITPFKKTKSVGMFSYGNNFIWFIHGQNDDNTTYGIDCLCYINGAATKTTILTGYPNDVAVTDFSVTYVDFEQKIFLLNDITEAKVFKATNLYSFNSGVPILEKINPFYSSDLGQITVRISEGYAYTTGFNPSIRIQHAKQHQPVYYFCLNNASNTTVVLENGANYVSLSKLNFEQNGYFNIFELKALNTTNTTDKYWTKAE